MNLLDIDADPVQSREHILLSTILDLAWQQASGDHGGCYDSAVAALGFGGLVLRNPVMTASGTWGYGLDYARRFRNLPYLAALELPEGETDAAKPSTSRKSAKKTSGRRARDRGPHKKDTT